MTACLGAATALAMQRRREERDWLEAREDEAALREIADMDDGRAWLEAGAAGRSGGAGTADG